jgi:hypothetical protein
MGDKKDRQGPVVTTCERSGGSHATTLPAARPSPWGNPGAFWTKRNSTATLGGNFGTKSLVSE